jgi:polyhydroxyalkanoate synthesis regulator phasin
MAEQPQTKDLFTRLTEAGEEAIHKIADMPGAAKLTEAVNTLRTRVDELQKRMRGLDELEERIAKLERRVDELSTAKPAPRRRTTSAASRKRAKPKEGEVRSSD